MSENDDSPERLTLSRWSRRKLEAARAKAAPEPQPPTPAQPAQVAQPLVAAPPAEEPLPPVESLTIDSDFTRFLAPKVDETIKRAALRKLFSDPHFNKMDGLDVYIDDYSKPDPLPEGMLAKLKHVYEALTEEDPPVEAAASAPQEVEQAAAPPAQDTGKESA